MENSHDGKLSYPRLGKCINHMNIININININNNSIIVVIIIIPIIIMNLSRVEGMSRPQNKSKTKD